MTDEPTKALIKYRIERAEETFKEGLLMRTEDHWNACANRLYYACFYAVSALLVKYGISSTRRALRLLFPAIFFESFLSVFICFWVSRPWCNLSPSMPGKHTINCRLWDFASNCLLICLLYFIGDQYSSR